MNADHRDFERPGDGVRDGRPHEKGAGKPRAFRHGDAVQVFAALSSFGEDFVGKRHRAADVVAAREFGHHASVGAVHVDLSVEGVRKEPFLVRNQGHARFVAGGFDTENKHSVGIVEIFRMRDGKKLCSTVCSEPSVCGKILYFPVTVLAPEPERHPCP